MQDRREALFERLRSQSGILESFSNDQLTEIFEKAHGQCYLCGDPIDFEKDSIEGDHIDPKGGDRPENICLTHKKCNARKRDLPIGLAKKLFALLRFCQAFNNLPSFDDALDHFVDGSRRPITYERSAEEGNMYITINFGTARSVKALLNVDPASSTEYCFCDVPVKNLFNDQEVQPRKISHEHVWKLLLDFTRHPIHEPSSLRLVTEGTTQTAKLMMCDGQHKALAQILLDRSTIPAKLYIDPDIQLIRTLIDTIQNRIKKLPLYPSIVMEKLSMIYRVEWQRYRNETQPPYTERRFIRAFRSDEQTTVKNRLREAIYSAILLGERDGEDHRILSYIESEKRRVGPDKIMSMNLFKKTMLKKLVYQKPCDFPVGTDDDFRLKEVNNLRKFLDFFVDVFFEYPLGIRRETDDKMKRIFKSGSVRAWVTILKSAINNRLSVIDVREMDKPFLREVTEESWTGILAILQRLEQHPIWNDNSPDVESKLNENKLETSETLFRDYSTPLSVQYLLAAT